MAIKKILEKLKSKLDQVTQFVQEDEKIIKDAEQLKNKLENEWNEFKEKNEYLKSKQKKEFEKTIEEFKKIEIPKHLEIISLLENTPLELTKIKSILQKYSEEIKETEKEIEEYNEQREKLRKQIKAEQLKKQLENQWKKFKEKNQYLKSIQKKEFEKIIEKIKKIKILENLEEVEKIENEIQKYNEKFIEKEIKENKELLRELDEHQKKAIIIDDKYNLVIAGAGSGKTKVLTTKIAYLVKRKKIEPERILAIAFQKKAKKEMQKRLKENFGLTRVKTKTFHSLGNKIAREKYNCININDKKQEKIIEEIIKAENKENSEFKKNFLEYLKYYGNDDKKETDFEKKEDYANYLRNKKYLTLDKRKVRSEAEKQIMNFFFTHKINGKEIKVQYEKPAEFMKYYKNGKEKIPKPDFYFPDFDIWYEHWSLDENGKVPWWFRIKTKQYKYYMNIKKQDFEKNGKILIETTNADFIKGENEFNKILENKFIEALNKKGIRDIELKEKPVEELFLQLRLKEDIIRFIQIAKVYNQTWKETEDIINNGNWKKKQFYFGKIANHIYKKYEEKLQQENKIDFNDMINKSIKLLKEEADFYKNTFDYILIDEYQDMNQQRFCLINELLKKNNKCKLFCVGDDWQAIMGFTGSSPKFFVNFDEYFKPNEKIYLPTNYRNSKTIIDVSNKFMEKKQNKRTIQPSYQNFKKEKKIKVCIYKNNHNIANHCTETIKKYKEEEKYQNKDFKILFRIQNSSENTHLKKLIEEKMSEIKKTETYTKTEKENTILMTIHKSKGLEAKIVFIINLNGGYLGFPCKIKDKDIFELVKVKETYKEDKIEEERRLFYVALTRAKEEVIIYAKKNYESEFLKEIEEFVIREDITNY